ncbi:hypothetical protein ABQX22_04640 [Xanthomonas sp. WHRI 1810A]
MLEDDHDTQREADLIGQRHRYHQQGPGDKTQQAFPDRHFLLQIAR